MGRVWLTVIKMRMVGGSLMLILAGFITSGCVQTNGTGQGDRELAPQYNTGAPELYGSPTGDISAAKQLDIGVNLFEYGPEVVVGAKEKEFQKQNKNVEVVYLHKVPEPIRRVESYALAVMLQNKLESTGAFKSVSLRPGETNVQDLIVTGRITRSTGNNLCILFTVEDSAGKTWVTDFGLEGQYSPQNYQQKKSQDPYLELFERFSNRLLNHITTLNPDYFKRLARVTDMRYASSLSPTVFSGYLGTDNYGHYKLTGMPADNDPFWKFAMKCRDEEVRIVENDFGQFYTKSMAKVYPQYFDWRQEYGGSMIEYERLVVEIEKDNDSARLQMIMDQLKTTGMTMLAQLGVMGTTGRYKNVDIEEFLITTVAIQGISYLISGLAVDNSGNLYFDMDKPFADNPKYQEFKRKAAEKSKQAESYHSYMQKQSAAFSTAAEPITVRLFKEDVELKGTVEEKFSKLRDKMEAVYHQETGGIHASATSTGA